MQALAWAGGGSVPSTRSDTQPHSHVWTRPRSYVELIARVSSQPGCSVHVFGAVESSPVKPVDHVCDNYAHLLVERSKILHCPRETLLSPRIGLWG